MSISPDTLVSDVELGAIVGVSARRVRQLAEQGTIERLERGRYALGASVRALLEEVAGGGSALVRERTRKLKAEADRAELELAKAKGLIAPIEQMQKAMDSACLMIRTNMMNIPQRAAMRLIGETNESKIKTVLREEITAALAQAAKEKIDPKDHSENE